MPFLYRKTYDLPPNDPRFLDLTEEEMAADLLEHLYHQVRLRRDDPNDRAMRDALAGTVEAARAIMQVDTSALDATVERFRSNQEPPAPRTIVRVLTRTPEKPSG